MQISLSLRRDSTLCKPVYIAILYARTRNSCVYKTTCSNVAFLLNAYWRPSINMFPCPARKRCGTRFQCWPGKRLVWAIEWLGDYSERTSKEEIVYPPLLQCRVRQNYGDKEFKSPKARMQYFRETNDAIMFISLLWTVQNIKIWTPSTLIQALRRFGKESMAARNYVWRIELISRLLLNFLQRIHGAARFPAGFGFQN